ncbi:MAG: hypothetical protein V7640_1439, partial [Betaproteobacteria bacterium]
EDSFDLEVALLDEPHPTLRLGPNQSVVFLWRATRGDDTDLIEAIDDVR